MELTENDKLIIEAINNNNVKEIYNLLTQLDFNYDILKKENINLFNKNAKFLKYFRGFYYYFNYKNKKAKILMKYSNPFIFLFHHLETLYEELSNLNSLFENKKIYYKKAKYFSKKEKNNLISCTKSFDCLLNIYSIENKYLKSYKYHIKCIKIKSYHYFLGYVLKINLIGIILMNK